MSSLQRALLHEKTFTFIPTDFFIGLSNLVEISRGGDDYICIGA
jgi:hypothetical protein